MKREVGFGWEDDKDVLVRVWVCVTKNLRNIRGQKS